MSPPPSQIATPDAPAGGLGIDTGFMVYNDFNYPNLNGLFDELDVQHSSTEMSFSVSVDDGETEWYVGLFRMVDA